MGLFGCSMGSGDGSVGTSGEGGGSATASAAAAGGAFGQGGGAGFDGGAGVDCDAVNSCGDYSRGCTGCAIKGACLEAYEGCFSDAACLDFNVCMAKCGADVDCQGACAKEFPAGTERYNTLVTCVLCEACPVSCAGFGSICP